MMQKRRNSIASALELCLFTMSKQLTVFNGSATHCVIAYVWNMSAAIICTMAWVHLSGHLCGPFY